MIMEVPQNGIVVVQKDLLEADYIGVSDGGQYADLVESVFFLFIG